MRIQTREKAGTRPSNIFKQLNEREALTDDGDGSGGGGRDDSVHQRLGAALELGELEDSGGACGGRERVSSLHFMEVFRKKAKEKFREKALSVDRKELPRSKDFCLGPFNSRQDRMGYGTVSDDGLRPPDSLCEDLVRRRPDVQAHLACKQSSQSSLIENETLE